MKNTAVIAYMAASAAVAAGQFTYGPDGITCAKANAAYCAGSSLDTDIIIRCNGTVGQAGRCTNVCVPSDPGVYSAHP